MGCNERKHVCVGAAGFAKQALTESSYSRECGDENVFHSSVMSLSEWLTWPVVLGPEAADL